MTTCDQRTDALRQALRIAFGATAIIAGADKFANILTDWAQYVSPIASNLIPFSPQVLMQVAGLVEIAVGVMLLTRWTLVAGYILAAWLTAIALNLAITGQFWDIAVRDLLLALSAYTLAELTSVCQANPRT